MILIRFGCKITKKREISDVNQVVLYVDLKSNQRWSSVLDVLVLFEDFAMHGTDFVD